MVCVAGSQESQKIRKASIWGTILVVKDFSGWGALSLLKFA